VAHWWFGRKDGIKETVGFTEGVRDGCWVGEGLGLWLGDGDGFADGLWLGLLDGEIDGFREG